MKTIVIKNFSFSNALPLGIIAGPCVLEGRQHALDIAHSLAEICRSLSMAFIFKASFDKANRTSMNGKRGLSFEESMNIFREISQQVNCPVMTDVHESSQCAIVAENVDVLQIPALLCRQTDLIKAAALTGKPLNIKKGQFLSPNEMLQVVKKAEAFGNTKLFLCERGSCFGYNALVNDMRCMPIMASSGYPVIFDATHSVQRPGALGDKSGGDRKFVETIGRAATAVGIAGIFIETHPDPDNASSDGPNMIPLRYMKSFLETLKSIDEVTKSRSYESFSLSTQNLL